MSTPKAGTPASEVRKAAGANFWNANPCGGDRASYREFLDWYIRTEPYIFDIIARYDWAGSEALEVGCGQGTVLNFLAPRGARVTAIDMSSMSLQRALGGARELGHAGAVRCVEADAEQLPFPEQSFDAALSIGVLHHSPDTAKGIEEIFRVLQPGGRAIVMLYRTGNPKWWATRAARGVSRILDSVSGRAATIASRLRGRRSDSDDAGTALLELFGVPILKAFSNREAAAMFSRFVDVRITNHQPGFRRMVDILPWLRSVEQPLGLVDSATQARWGFYQVIEAVKPGAPARVREFAGRPRFS
jgi:SAM-dependent methyltransferase